jgi:hypothetical protein
MLLIMVCKNKGVLIAASSTPQPLGLAGSGSKFDAFSVYGFDIMLTDDFKPIVIETNFSPDCTRACQVSDAVFKTKKRSRY